MRILSSLYYYSKIKIIRFLHSAVFTPIDEKNVTHRQTLLRTKNFQAHRTTTRNDLPKMLYELDKSDSQITDNLKLWVI